MGDERGEAAAYEEVLSQAVDRQLAEQRALREALEELRDAVRDLAARSAQAAPVDLDLSGLEERIRGALDTNARSVDELRQAAHDLATSQAPSLDVSGMEERLRLALDLGLRGADESIRSAIHTSVTGATESTFASLSEQLRSLREAMLPRLEQAALATDTVRDIGSRLEDVRASVGGVSADIEGIARALIDFNSGLREWATDLEGSVSSIRETVGELRTRAEAVAEERRTADREAADKEPRADGGSEAETDTRSIDERIRETSDLSVYLADQIEDLDGLMARLAELPPQLEGVMSQAMRRTLAARAKLDRDAETALDDVLAALEDHVNQLAGVLQRFEQEEDHLRKVALEQVELGSRIESLQSVFVDRLDSIDADRRRGEEALAVAIDRSARGLEPRALEALTKSAKGRGAKPRKAAPKAATGKRAAAKKAPRKPKRGKAKRPATRKSKGRDWTPLSDADEDTLA